MQASVLFSDIAPTLSSKETRVEGGNGGEIKGGRLAGRPVTFRALDSAPCGFILFVLRDTGLSEALCIYSKIPGNNVACSLGCPDPHNHEQVISDFSMEYSAPGANLVFAGHLASHFPPELTTSRSDRGMHTTISFSASEYYRQYTLKRHHCSQAPPPR